MTGLFKYFPVDRDKVELLTHQQVQLTPPKFFNDPWDFLVRRDPITDEEVRNLFEEFQRERPSNLSLDEFKAGHAT